MGPSYNCKVQLYSSPQIAETSRLLRHDFLLKVFSGTLDQDDPVVQAGIAGDGSHVWSVLEKQHRITWHRLKKTKSENLIFSDEVKLKGIGLIIGFAAS